MKYLVSVLLLYCLQTITCAHNDKLPILTSILLAQCRARCINKFSPDPVSVTKNTCYKDKECFMCWDSCSLLIKDIEVWGHMCSDKRICFPGCVESCNFFLMDRRDIKDLNYELLRYFGFTESLWVQHRHESDRFKWGPPSSTKVDEKFINDPKVKKETGGIVYTMLEYDFSTLVWTEVDQTVDLWMDTPSFKGKNVGFILVAVNATHVLTKEQLQYSYITANEDFAPDEETTVISIHASIQDIQADDSTDSPIEVPAPLSLSPESSSKTRFNRKEDFRTKPLSWNLSVERITESPQLGMVEVDLSWGDMTSEGWETPSYMVTWEKYGSREGLKAYRMSDTNRIQLSLLPESIYTVIVESFSSHYGALKSPEIQVSTHNIIRQDKANDTFKESLKNKEVLLNVELMIGLAVGVACFALLTGSFVYFIYRKLNKKPPATPPITPIYPHIIVTDDKLSNMALVNMGHSLPNLGSTLKDSCSLPNLKGYTDSPKSCFGLVYVPVPSAPPRSEHGLLSQLSDKHGHNRLEIPTYLSPTFSNPFSTSFNKNTIREEEV